MVCHYFCYHNQFLKKNNFKVYIITFESIVISENLNKFSNNVIIKAYIIENMSFCTNKTQFPKLSLISYTSETKVPGKVISLYDT